MKQQKAWKVGNLNLDEAHLIEQLRQHPTIMARVQSILKPCRRTRAYRYSNCWSCWPSSQSHSRCLPTRYVTPDILRDCSQWPSEWRPLIQHYAALSREQIRDTFAAFCNARPAGGKFAHRATDGPAGSSPSMKWVNPPVAYMLHAGVPLLMDAGVDLPGLLAGDPARIALEGYPGLLAREVLGGRSYKSDARARQTVERQTARRDLVDALRAGRTRLGLRLCTTEAQRDVLIDDASADRLDAVLCLMQAAWGSTRVRHGLPENVDPIEGWIVSAG